MPASGTNNQNTVHTVNFMIENIVGEMIPIIAIVMAFSLGMGGVGVGLPGVGIIIAIVMAFSLGMLAVFSKYRNRRDMFSLYHQERMAAIEKGIELPPLPEDFFREDAGDGQAPRRAGHGTLLFGLILLFTGLTLYLVLHFTVAHMDAGGDAGLYALIPAGMGVACLIYYFAVGRKLAAAREAERQARLAEAARSRNPPV
jgi:Na+-driven multidrug efflux pump